METVTIPKQEYDLFLKLKKNKDFTSISFSKKEFNPKDFCGLGKSSKKEIDQYLENIRNKWKQNF